MNQNFPAISSKTFSLFSKSKHLNNQTHIYCLGQPNKNFFLCKSNKLNFNFVIHPTFRAIFCELFTTNGYLGQLLVKLFHFSTIFFE